MVLRPLLSSSIFKTRNEPLGVAKKQFVENVGLQINLLMGRMQDEVD